jgi:hypothetical protein
MTLLYWKAVEVWLGSWRFLWWSRITESQKNLVTKIVSFYIVYSDNRHIKIHSGSSSVAIATMKYKSIRTSTTSSQNLKARHQLKSRNNWIPVTKIKPGILSKQKNSIHRNNLISTKVSRLKWHSQKAILYARAAVTQNPRKSVQKYSNFRYFKI